MIKENVKIDTGNIVTYRRSKKTNDILYFSHANGFCGQVYTDLLNKIDDSYEVSTYDMSGHGASDLIASIFGDAGMHTRAAVSVNSLPLGVAVEVDSIFELK